MSIVSVVQAGDADIPQPTTEGHVLRARLAQPTRTAWEPMSVGSADLADGAVATAKLADNAVATAKLADGAVTPDKLVAGAEVEGQLFYVNAAGALVRLEPPAANRDQHRLVPGTAGSPRWRRLATVRKTLSTSMAGTGTPWGDSNTALDLVVPGVEAGDWLEFALSVLWLNEATDGLLTGVTMVGGARVNPIGGSGGIGNDSNGDGISAWNGFPSVYTGVGPTVRYQTVAGDIAADGSVTVRMRHRRGAAGVTKTLYAAANRPMEWSATNLGP